VLKEFDAARLRRYPNPTSAAIRGLVAGMFRCDASNVLVANGSDELLSLCVRVFVENDGVVGYFVPSYSLYPVLAGVRGLKQAPLELDAEYRWRMPGDYDCDLFFLTHPNAPTGMVYPRATIEAFCGRTRGVVVIDEAYADFAGSNLVDLALSRPNVLVARTLSKSHSMAGLRLGFAIGPGPLIEALDKVKDSYNVDVLAQELGLAALTDTGHVARNVAMIRNTRERLAKALLAMGHRVYPSSANFLWVEPAGIGAAELQAKLRDRRIFIRHFPGRRTEECVRITVGTDDEVDTLLRAMEDMRP
jgi:histidinol-phosphate aminotransferase